MKSFKRQSLTVVHTCAFKVSFMILRLYKLDGQLLAIDLQDKGPRKKFIQTLFERLKRQENFCFKNSAQLFVTEKKALKAYFDGSLRSFDLPVIVAGTKFEKRVWKGISSIEYGKTMSYGELGRLIKCQCAQAVGQACGRNPLTLIIPCHRVIAAGGKLGGFGGGEHIKKRLLALESGL